MSSTTLTGKIKNKIKAHDKMKSKFYLVADDVYIRKTVKGDKTYTRQMKDAAVHEHLQYTAESIKKLTRRK